MAWLPLQGLQTAASWEIEFGNLLSTKRSKIKIDVTITITVKEKRNK